MAAALALGERGAGRSGLNPSVGCIIVKNDRVVGRGWTQSGGRPHAEAMALDQAGSATEGAAIYLTLEPCMHQSERGPACARSLVEARPRRVVIAIQDPDPRTAGKGTTLLRHAGIEVESGLMKSEARYSMAGFFTRIEQGRPHVTLKLAISLDGKIAMTDGTSRWITGAAARAHVHLERARCDIILVGGGTLAADKPSLDVRLPGIEARSALRAVLTSQNVPDGWNAIARPGDVASLQGNLLLVEGGAATAASFLKAGLVDRLLLYRAPILLGAGKACLDDIGLGNLDSAHGHWKLTDSRMLGLDRMELYDCAQAA